MATYTAIVAQKKVDGKWVTLEPIELGFNPELPHHYGKLNMMSDLDPPEFKAANPRVFSIRQSFQSPSEYTMLSESAPWAKRGYPDDGMDDYLRDVVFDEHYIDEASWATLDEILAFDYDKPVLYGRVTTTFSELLGPGYRLWFEKLKAYGAERVIYSNC